MISPDLATAFNEQIGHEFGASMQYVSIAAHFQRTNLTLLAKLFFEQAEEERRKLEAMRAEFESFLGELRRVKDQEEFNRFMGEFRNRTSGGSQAS